MFANRDDIAAALDSNRSERQSDLQKHFEGYLLGTAKPLSEQSSEELEENTTSGAWVEGSQLERTSLRR